MDDDGGTLSVEELVEYCRTQAGLPSGRAGTIGGEIGELLDGIDRDISELRTRIAEQANGAEGPTVSPAPVDPGERGSADLEGVAAAVRERDLEEKRTLAGAKQARMAAVQDLTTAHLELAEELGASVDDGRATLDRVVRFDREHDAPAYFDDRRTVLEAAAE